MRQNTEKTTGFVSVHEDIGRDGCIVELRRADHDAPMEGDMSHLSEEKARELRDQLTEYIEQSESE